MLGDRAHPQQAMGWFPVRHEAPVFAVTIKCMAWCQVNSDTSQGDVVFAGKGQQYPWGRTDCVLLTQSQPHHRDPWHFWLLGCLPGWWRHCPPGQLHSLPNSSFLEIFKPEAAFLPEWTGINTDLSPLRKWPPSLSEIAQPLLGQHDHSWASTLRLQRPRSNRAPISRAILVG